MSRKLSIRCPDELWARLIAEARGGSLSTVITRKLGQTGSAIPGRETKSTFLWLVLALLIGCLVAAYLAKWRNQHKTQPKDGEV